MAEGPQSTVRVDAETGGAKDEIKGLGSIFGGLFGTIAGGVASGNALTGALSGIFSGISKLSGAVVGFVGDSVAMNANLETVTLQFGTLMGDAEAARQKVKDLFEFAKVTPFETQPVINASKTLQVFGGAALNTNKNLLMVGDAAAATNAPIEEVAMWTGRLYAALQAGKPFGEAAQRLGELGIMGPKVRGEMEALQKSGANGKEIWDKFTTSMGQFKGAMEAQSNTWQGLKSTFTDTISILGANVFAPFFDMARAGLKTIVDLLGTEGVANAARGMGNAVGAAFRIARDAIGPVITAVIAAAKGFMGAADGTVAYTVVVKALVPIIAMFVDSIADTIRAIAAAIAVYYQFRIAGNTLLIEFGKVVEGMLKQAQTILYTMAAITPGDAGAKFTTWGDAVSNSLIRVRKDMTGLATDNDKFKDKQAAISGGMLAFADNLSAASNQMRKQADEYKYVEPAQAKFKATTAETSTTVNEFGATVKKTKEKISEFAKTSTYEIAELAKEWRQQPAAIKQNEESIKLLLDKYEKLRNGATKASELPKDLETLRDAFLKPIKPTRDLSTAIAQVPFKNMKAEADAGTAAIRGLTSDGLLPVTRSYNTLAPLVKTNTGNMQAWRQETVNAQRAARELAERDLDAIVTSLQKLSQIAPGAFGAIAQGLGGVLAATSSVMKGMDSVKDGIAALNKGDALSGITGLVGGLSSIGAAVSTIVNLGKQMWDALFGSAGRDLVKDFVRTEVAGGSFEALHQKLLALGARGEELWIKLTQGVGRNNPEQAKAAIALVTAALEEQEQKQQALIAANNQQLASLLDSETVYGRLPDEIAAYLDKLVAAGLLTQENADKLRAMGSSGSSNFQQLKRDAEAFGVDLNALGPAFRQAELDDEARKIIKAFEEFNSVVGSDTGAILTGMADEISAVVQKSIQFGTSIPENMRPWIEKLAASGQLLDANGNKITDISNLKFGDKIKTGLDDVVSKLQEMIDLMKKGVGGAMDDVDAKVRGNGFTWDEWRRRAREAIDDVRNGVEGLTYGDSPGGMKEWSPMLRGTAREFGSLRQAAMSALADMRSGVDGIAGVGMPGISLAEAAVNEGDRYAFSIDARGSTIRSEEDIRQLKNKILDQAKKDLLRSRYYNARA